MSFSLQFCLLRDFFFVFLIYYIVFAWKRAFINYVMQIWRFMTPLPPRSHCYTFGPINTNPFFPSSHDIIYELSLNESSFFVCSYHILSFFYINKQSFPNLYIIENIPRLEQRFTNRTFMYYVAQNGWGISWQQCIRPRW